MDILAEMPFCVRVCKFLFFPIYVADILEDAFLFTRIYFFDVGSDVLYALCDFFVCFLEVDYMKGGVARNPYGTCCFIELFLLRRTKMALKNRILGNTAAEEAELTEEEAKVKEELKKRLEQKRKDIEAMKAECQLLSNKVYSFDNLIDFLKVLHEAGGDKAVSRYLMIYGDAVKLDDQIAEIDEIEEALWYNNEAVICDHRDGVKINSRLAKLEKEREDLIAEKNALASSIGIMSDCMFGYANRRRDMNRYFG